MLVVFLKCIEMLNLNQNCLRKIFYWMAPGAVNFEGHSLYEATDWLPKNRNQKHKTEKNPRKLKKNLEYEIVNKT